VGKGNDSFSFENQTAESNYLLNFTTNLLQRMKLLIFGGHSTALDIFEVAQQNYKDQFEEILFVVGDDEFLPSDSPFLRDKDLEDMEQKSDYCYILSFSNHLLRRKLSQMLNDLGFHPVSIIHPTAVISSSSNVGEGCYVGANVVITQNVMIGNHCLINYQSSIGHDSTIGNNVILNPASCISGNVSIGDDSLIGANAFVLQGVKVGKHCLIDAMTYIDRNIEDGMLCKNRSLEIVQRKSFQPNR
jgi:sugar O-acyltransferase (sialic acid O-acetyltransferase NeuD family)